MASSTVAALTASDALTGASLFYADGLASAVAADVKVTATQIKTWTSASPTLVTPVLGVATGTSIALGGATIGTNALAVTGTSNFSLQMTVGGGAGFANTGVVTSGLIVGTNAGGGAMVGERIRGYSTSNLVFEAILGISQTYNSTTYIGWTNSATTATTSDTTLSRNAAGVIQFGTTAANAAGSWLATNGTLTGLLDMSGGGAQANITTVRIKNINNQNNNDAMFTFTDSSPHVTISSGASAALLRFGGTTTSFPALKRSTTLLLVRLANDSAYAPLEADTLRTATAYTVATLPAAGTAGRMAYVTDALAPSFLTTVVGGGAVVAPVFDNGTNWVGA